MRAGGSVDVGWMVYLGGYPLFHLIRLAMLTHQRAFRRNACVPFVVDAVMPAGWVLAYRLSDYASSACVSCWETRDFRVFPIHSAAACLAAATASSSQRLLKAFSAWPLTQ